MHTASHHELPQNPLQIKQDEKFFSRLLSKEKSSLNSSCRVYYGGAAGAIPFTWESRPGTPKHAFSDTSIPPLTPPPSYHCNPDSKMKKPYSKPNILRAIFPKLARRKTHVSPSSLSSSSSSSSTSSYSSTSGSGNRKFRGRRSFSCTRLLSFGEEDDDDDDDFGSPTSTLCFGVRRKILSGSPMVNTKKKLLAIVGHGSGQGIA